MNCENKTQGFRGPPHEPPPTSPPAGATHLDDGRDELLEEVGLQQVRPVVVEEVDEQALDVRAVLVLVGHDHHVSVAQRLQRVGAHVLLLVAQPDDLDQVVDLGVLHDLRARASPEFNIRTAFDNTPVLHSVTLVGTLDRAESFIVITKPIDNKRSATRGERAHHSPACAMPPARSAPSRAAGTRRSGRVR